MYTSKGGFMKKPAFSLERANLEITTRDKLTCTLTKKALIVNHCLCGSTQEEMAEANKPQVKRLHTLINTTVCAVRAGSLIELFNHNYKENRDILFVQVYELYRGQEKTLATFYLKPVNDFKVFNILTSRIVHLIHSHLVNSINNILDTMH